MSSVNRNLVYSIYMNVTMKDLLSYQIIGFNFYFFSLFEIT